MNYLNYTSAGKVFVLGEYAVLTHLPAVVAAIEPRFTARIQVAAPTDISVNAPRQGSSLGSPLERLHEWAAKRGFSRLSFNVEDPHRGSGGFGASTAEFAMAYLAYANQNSLEERNWKQVWSLYRELMQVGSPLPPSGADLVAQWQGGVVFFDPSDRYCMDVWPIFDWSRLLVFSATSMSSGRKVATHQNISQLVERGFPKTYSGLIENLEKQLLAGIGAIQENDFRGLGTAMTQYAEALHQAGLELPASHEDRIALQKLPGVVGVKGSGALLADAVLVLMGTHTESERRSVIQTAEERGLKLICDGLTCQMGVTCPI